MRVIFEILKRIYAASYFNNVIFNKTKKKKTPVRIRLKEYMVSHNGWIRKRQYNVYIVVQGIFIFVSLLDSRQLSVLSKPPRGGLRQKIIIFVIFPREPLRLVDSRRPVAKSGGYISVHS